jgi:hypothetical protein
MIKALVAEVNEEALLYEDFQGRRGSVLLKSIVWWRGVG